LQVQAGMSRLPLSALAAALLACGPPPPPVHLEPSAARALVRVATWNVHDLFDAEDRLVPPGAGDAVPPAYEVEAKLDRVAAVLRRVDADVVLLQEVENATILGDLAARAGYPEARLVEGNDPRGIDVAVLARLPLLAYVSHLADRDGAGRPLWPRDCVEAHLAAGDGARLVLLGSHLSSALSDDGTRRALQAARLRELADGARAGGASLVVAGGDLNDVAASAALAPLLGDGVWVEPAAALPPELAWTWFGAGRREALDHLVVPRASAGAVLHAEVMGGADVEAASDHRPVVLDLW
jgi:endonuclease/exonuclease/phosphatase family metal-dependent hydrolase